MNTIAKRVMLALIVNLCASSLICLLYDYETLGAGLIVAVISFGTFLFLELLSSILTNTAFRNFVPNVNLASKFVPHLSLVVLVLVGGLIYYKFVPNEGRDYIVAFVVQFLLGYSAAAVAYLSSFGIGRP